MQKKRFDTIDGETLMTRPLQSINFVIGTFMSQGLHLLAGASKAGKVNLTYPHSQHTIFLLQVVPPLSP